MPVISRFYGITIIMYYLDHNPPHIHVRYSEREAIMNLDGYVLDGSIPHRALKLVRDWIDIYRVELELNWQRSQNGMELKKIKPLN